MALLLHIIIALASLAFTAFTYVSPSAGKLQGSYMLVALTVISGTYLVIAKPAHILESCIMGLAFVGVSLVGTVAARAKLAKAE